MATATAPLIALLDQIQVRLQELEKRAGVAPAAAGSVTPAASGASAAPAAAAVESSPAVVALDALVAKFGEGTQAAGKAMGGDGAILGEAYYGLWKWLRALVDAAGKCKKPDDAALKAYLGEAQEHGKRVQEVLKRAKPEDFLEHARAAAEGLSAFFLFTTPGTLPLAVVQNGLEQFEFYGMRVRKASKDAGKPEWMAWANLVRDGYKALSAWVTENDLKPGLTWNGRGGDFAAHVKSAGGAAAAPAPAAAAPAAAAPAPAPAAAAAASSSSPASSSPAGGAAALSSLFKQISSIDQSSGRTEGLRHVTKDMKASALKEAGAPVVVAPKTAVAPRKSADEPLPTGTPAVELRDVRWHVEFHTSGEIRLPGTTGKSLEAKHEVYIYGCSNCVVYVDSKCKGVRMDKCRNVVLFVQSLLSGIEVVNVKKVKMQVQVSVPSVAIDKSDSVTVGLCYASRGTQIVSSKSSDMNVTFPVSEAEDADWVESPIPEQFVSKIGKDGKVSTGVSDLYSA